MEDETFKQLIAALEEVRNGLEAQGRLNRLFVAEQDKIWDAVAAVRDDMHLAIRGLTLAPEAVADAIHPATRTVDND